jgi:cyclopropane-fatty-acyl-phospholipid synthase
MYTALLSQEQTYSSAIWPSNLGGPRGDLTSIETELGDLESAQLIKIRHVLDQARVKAGTRLLEFGSGWGSLAIEAARRGAQVDTLTLSVEQQTGARQRIAALGLQGSIRVHLLDYRKVPEVFEAASFDAFVAVEMIEVSIQLVLLFVMDMYS